MPGVGLLCGWIGELPHHLVRLERRPLQTARWLKGVEEDGGSLGAARLLPEAAPPVAAVPPHLLLLDLHGQTMSCHWV